MDLTIEMVVFVVGITLWVMVLKTIALVKAIRLQNGAMEVMRDVVEMYRDLVERLEL